MQGIICSLCGTQSLKCSFCCPQKLSNFVVPNTQTARQEGVFFLRGHIYSFLCGCLLLHDCVAQNGHALHAGGSFVLVFLSMPCSFCCKTAEGESVEWPVGLIADPLGDHSQSCQCLVVILVSRTTRVVAGVVVSWLLLSCSRRVLLLMCLDLFLELFLSLTYYFT